LGESVRYSAAPGWRADQRVVELKERFDFAYNSDCRGTAAFYPRLKSGQAGTVQIPVTVPTFDEVVGTECDMAGFNQYICDAIEKQPFPVYTIHAEVEGIVMTEQFEQLLVMFKERQWQPVTLGALLAEQPASIITDVKRDALLGREGWVGWQDNKNEEAYAPSSL